MAKCKFCDVEMNDTFTLNENGETTKCFTCPICRNTTKPREVSFDDNGKIVFVDKKNKQRTDKNKPNYRSKNKQGGFKKGNKGEVKKNGRK